MMTKREILEAMRSLGLARLGGIDERLKRELYITPFPGAHGTAGIVITLNGTPPPLVVAIVPGGSSDSDGNYPEVYDLNGGRARRFGRSEKPAYLALRALFNELREKAAPVEL